jgi:hypothetical protein
MAHYFYFAEDKINSFYNDAVERTEKEIITTQANTVSSKLLGKGKITLGKILSLLGLPGLEAEVGAKIAGESARSRKVVSYLAPEQKLRIIRTRLSRDERLLDLREGPIGSRLPTRPTYVLFKTMLSLDVDARSVNDVEKTKSAVFAGSLANYTLRIEAYVDYMRSPNAWRRFINVETRVAGFGTLNNVNKESHVARIDPIVLCYDVE